MLIRLSNLNDFERILFCWGKARFARKSFFVPALAGYFGVISIKKEKK